MAGELPQNIVDAIAISNAKSIGEQPAILANIALANLIANTNMSQQSALANMQAINSVTIAIVSKAAEMILNSDAKSASEFGNLKDIIRLVGSMQNPNAGDFARTVNDIVDRMAKPGAADATSQAPSAAPPGESGL